MPECLFHSSEACHQVKKGHKVCKACWKEATVLKQETLKQHMDGFCMKLACWDWAVPTTSFCTEHTPERVTLASPSPSPTRDLGRSRSPAPRPSRASSSYLRELSTNQLVDSMADMLAELAYRARGGTSGQTF